MQYVLCRRICGITLLLSLLCSILFLSPQASACSRGYEPSLEDDYLEAASIFTGKVIKVERIYFEGTLSKQVTFELNRLYKGQFGSVLTNMESDQCGTNFIQGATYLVFARSDGDHLHTSTFGVHLFSQSTERIDWLDKRMQKTKEIHKAGTEKINVQRKGIKVQIDNQLLPSDSRLFLYEHTVFVPSDYLTTLLGYQVIWKPQQKQLDIFSPKVDINKGSPVSESQTERQKKISEPVTLSVTFDRIQLHRAEKSYGAVSQFKSSIRADQNNRRTNRL